ncbi:hypothetical protein RYH80_05420 [Halobaculum sp. MBLA0147]|uniref:hypothetical protein n=1 Tax=Halobaculum sp. MBLA0147 TaxID=3079934 RepID=UPI003525FE02
MNDTEVAPQEATHLVDQNGLSQLFANRVRARVLVTLSYADEPLTPAAVADAAGVTESAVYEALDPLADFELFDTTPVEGTDDSTGRGDDEPLRYALASDDELVAALERVARLATERLHPEDGEESN